MHRHGNASHPVKLVLRRLWRTYLSEHISVRGEPCDCGRCIEWLMNPLERNSITIGSVNTGAIQFMTLNLYYLKRQL
jgi:hypothetical protein